jgi:D-amino-acid dehydrogenase
MTTVVDRQSQAAKETSFTHEGHISYGDSSPRAAPCIPQKELKWRFEAHGTTPLLTKIISKQTCT